MYTLPIIFYIFLIIFLFLLTILIRGISRIKDQPEGSGLYPFISVIVSLHDEEKNIHGLISALAVQDYPEDLWEMILVDDRSTDKTANLLSGYSRSLKNMKVIQIRETPPEYAPKKYAIHRAIQAARGSLILLTDADGRPGPAWLRCINNYFTNFTGLVIGYAPYEVTPPYNKPVHKLLALEYMSHAAVAAATTGLGFPLTCVGTNLAYLKEVYTDLDGFGQFKHYHSGDDDLFMQRVRDELQCKIAYTMQPETHVHNAPPVTWNQFFNQRLRYASKGFFYPKWISSILVFYFLFNFLLFFSPLLLLYQPSIIFFILPVLFIKWLTEFIFLSRFAVRVRQRNLLRYFLPAAILHIPYVVFFGFLGSFLNYQWAGRKK